MEVFTPEVSHSCLSLLRRIHSEESVLKAFTGTVWEQLLISQTFPDRKMLLFMSE